MRMLLLFILVLAWSSPRAIAASGCDEYFARAASLLAFSAHGKVGGSHADQFLDSLPTEKISHKANRTEELTRVLTTRLGKSASLASLGDPAQDNFEVYEVKAGPETYILKVFGEGGRKSQRQFIRENGVYWALNDSHSLLHLAEGVDVFTLEDATGTHPTLLMKKAPGEGLDVLIAGAAGNQTGLFVAETALNMTGKALADFHAKERVASPSKRIRKEARELLKEEHLKKFSRWFEADSETPISVVDRLVADRILNAAQAKAFVKLLKEELKEAEGNAPELTTVVHGDAKPSNFFFDRHNGMVTTIDLETMGRSLDRTGDPAEDVGRMLGSLEKAGTIAGLSGHEIKLLQNSFLDAYLRGNESEHEFSKRVQFYRLRYWGVTLGDPNSRLTPAERRHLAENLLDEAEISRPEVHALQGLLDAPYKDLDDIELPDRIRLNLGDHDSGSMFHLANEAWDEIYDPKELKAQLSAILKKPGATIPAEGFRYLKALRKRALLLRSSFQVFDESHEPPKKIHQFVQIFGELNDAIANGKTKPTARAAKDLLDLVEAKEPTYSLSHFSPATSRSIAKHLDETMEAIEASLTKPTLSVREFHAVRKSVRQMQAFVRLLQASAPSEAKASALDYLHALNLQTGSLHDKFVTQSLNGDVDYEKAKLTVPQDLRKNLKQLFDRLRVAP